MQGIEDQQLPQGRLAHPCPQQGRAGENPVGHGAQGFRAHRIAAGHRAWHHPVLCRPYPKPSVIAPIKGKATSLDIAHLAGVSQPTVSRALRGSPMVNEETRKRIETALTVGSTITITDTGIGTETGKEGTDFITLTNPPGKDG